MNYFLNYINKNTIFDNLSFNDDILHNFSRPDFFIKEKSNTEFDLEVELPGHDKNTIELEEYEGYLIIKRKLKNEEEKDKLLLKKFNLSENIRVKSANIKNGLLKVSLMKFIPDNEKAKLIPLN